MKIGDYILIKNKYVGKIIKFLWNNTNLIAKLENYTDYVDPTLKSYNNLLENNNKEGYILSTINKDVYELSDLMLEQNILNYHDSIEKIGIKIQINFNKYIQGLKTFINKDTIEVNYEENNNNKNDKNDIKIPKVSIKKIHTYQKQDMKEDDYEKYILNMLSNLFEEKKVIYDEVFLNENPSKYTPSIEFLSESDIIKVKNILKQILEKYFKIDDDEYYNFKNTLMYKHLIFDNELDTFSLGKQIIVKIKEQLYRYQNRLKLETERIELNNFTDNTNLFDFIKFRIVGDYLELININNNDNDFRKITQHLVPHLSLLQEEYGLPIDYKKLFNMILENKTPDEILSNKDKIKEAIKILSQEYYICLQPKVELLLWTICRLIICWYSDKILYDNIYKIKILINLYRSRGLKEFNQDYDVLPIITIIPKYGKEYAVKVGSHLNYYFFVYKKLGNDESQPTYFRKIDELMYYTNGSLEIKKHVKLILSKNKKTAKLLNEYQNKVEDTKYIKDMNIMNEEIKKY